MFYPIVFLVPCYLASLAMVSGLVPGDIASNPLCDLPSLDKVDESMDMLGTQERENICSLPRFARLCPKGKGPADEFCKKIARAAGRTSDARCLRNRTCAFRVKSPFRHPKKPGDAFVSLCKTDYDGVIYPCGDNNLHIVDPTYNSDLVGSDEENVAAPNWKPLGIERCGIVDKSIEKFEISSKKIIGGVPTKRGQFPWQVVIYGKPKTSDGADSYILMCGGSIITEKHILSAAHCFTNGDTYSYKLIVGEYDRSVVEEDEQEFQFTHEDIYSHPDYNKFTDENDIAVIYLKGLIRLNKYVQPICLPAQTLEYKDKLNCVVSGWGRTKDINSAEFNSVQLRAARLSTLPTEDCTQEKAYGSKIKDTMFCAGTLKGGVDSCQGDSGGPLVCDIEDVDDRHILIQYGIVSFGTGCGVVNKPGVYTKLSDYETWIDQTLKDSTKNIAVLVEKKTSG